MAELVDVSVLEQPGSDVVVLTYELGGNVSKKSFDFVPDGDGFVATMEGETSDGEKFYNKSSKIPRATKENLKEQKTEVDSKIYVKVTLKKKDKAMETVKKYFEH